MEPEKKRKNCADIKLIKDRGVYICRNESRSALTRKAMLMPLRVQVARPRENTTYVIHDINSLRKPSKYTHYDVRCARVQVDGLASAISVPPICVRYLCGAATAALNRSIPHVIRLGGKIGSERLVVRSQPSTRLNFAMRSSWTCLHSTVLPLRRSNQRPTGVTRVQSPSAPQAIAQGVVEAVRARASRDANRSHGRGGSRRDQVADEAARLHEEAAALQQQLYIKVRGARRETAFVHAQFRRFLAAYAHTAAPICRVANTSCSRLYYILGCRSCEARRFQTRASAKRRDDGRLRFAPSELAAAA
ncbi:unnamed protein product [Trichogramma brassicae]|uniref:Uncharacterized protein n=1 Tax=Trichogramma brassicae TaxID=86971 RepID=A0A6H5I3X6_9HYME|nr:unnamed protein product [Trichogramma brassicae]